MDTSSTTVDVKPLRGRARSRPRRCSRTKRRSEYPAVGPAPADRHLPSVAGNSHLLRLSRCRYRSLLDRGQYTEVMLSPREMNLEQLPDTAQTWVNQHLKFTHGTGLAMSPVNRRTPKGCRFSM